MEYSIIVYDEAKQDIIEIVKWYDLKSIGLGDRFIVWLDEAIIKLSKNPEAYSILYDEVRKIKLKKFPYIVFLKCISKLFGFMGLYIQNEIRSCIKFV